MLIPRAIALALAMLALEKPALAGDAGEIAGAARLVDADTIRVGRERIKLYGLDACEKGQPAMTPRGEIDCGAWATKQARPLAEGAWLRCAWSRRDRYGRPLATCLSDDGRDLARTLIETGAAFVYRRKSGRPDAPTGYVEAEARARSARLGVWRWRVDPPGDWRRARREASRSRP